MTCTHPPRGLRRAVSYPLAETKVVIVGQDPYPTAGQAHGLAFSVPEGAVVPDTLTNILEELDEEDRPILAMATWNRGRGEECCFSTPR